MIQSPLTRGRGLKHNYPAASKIGSLVAPHAGAWIETQVHCIVLCLCPVAPHAGAWIETKAPQNGLKVFLVAPHAGAWIETACWL